MSDDYKNYLKIGKIIDAHALKGEVFVYIFSGDLSWSEESSECVLSQDSDQCTSGQVFEIEKVTPFKNGLRMKFLGVNDRNQSEALKGSFLYLHPDTFISDEGETIFLREILGFQVLRVDGSVIGIIKGFSSNGVQDLLVIETTEKSIEVPFVEAFTKEIFYDKKQIILDLPEGMENLDS